MEDIDYVKITEELQRLRDEQQRLRDEQERLRREEKPVSSNGHGSSGDRRGKTQDKSPDQTSEKDEPGKAEPAKAESKDDAEGDKKDQEGGDEEQEQPKPPLKQRVQTFVREHPRSILYGVIGFVIFCILAFFLIMYLNSYESTDDAQIDGHLNAISSRITGTINAVHVEDNQVVTAGQLLVELDPRDYQLSVDQAKSNYAAAQAQLNAENPSVPITQTSNQTTISSGGADVQSAQSGVAEAQKQYEAKLADLRAAQASDLKAQKDVLRYRPLVEKGEISKQQFDAVVAEANNQAAKVDAAQAGAGAAQKTIEQRRDQLKQATTKLLEANQNAPRNVAIRQATVASREAASQAAKAQSEQAELNFTYTKIFAPVGGIIGQKSVEVGQRVEVGQQLLAITQVEDVWITANFKETQLKKMKPGQDVDISVDALGKKLHGYVASMPGATGAVTSLLPPENATGNFVKVVQRLPVRIRLKDGEDPGHLLRPGMSVEPKVWLK